jgi:integrase
LVFGVVVMKTLIEEGIYKIENGSSTVYQVVVSKRANGKRFYRQETVPNLTQARLAKKILFADVIERTKEKDLPTFGEFLDTFLEEVVRIWSPNTIYRRSSLLNCHYRPHFGDRRINEITSKEIVDHFEQQTNGKAWSSKRELLKTIKGVFQRAVDLELIDKNPVLTVPKPKGKTRDPQVLSEDQVKLLLGDLKENHTELFFHVALAVHTLARAGELRALTWADIDFSTRLINISKTRDPKTGLKLSTKGNEIRKVWINDELMELLKELKQTTFSASSDQVLPHWREFAQNEQGKPLKIFCQRLGLPLIRFHDLRASGITILLNRGVPLPQVMKLAMDSKINSLFASS